jgi:hypothetical protein
MRSKDGRTTEALRCVTTAVIAPPQPPVEGCWNVTDKGCDECQIRERLGRNVLMVDGGNLDEHDELYTTDAVWQFGTTVRTGLDEIVRGARDGRQAGGSGPGSGIRHILTTLSLKISGDSAVAHSYFVMIDTASAPVSIKVAGTYVDTLVRSDADWKISHREVVV